MPCIVLDPDCRVPLTPLDAAWSLDGRVYATFADSSLVDVFVGLLEPLEEYPHRVEWRVLSSGDGYRVPVRERAA